MHHAWHIEQISEHLVEQLSIMDDECPEVHCIPVGILIARPEHDLASKEILPSLEYFHHRSGDYINFYCVGYGRFWPDYEYMRREYPEMVPEEIYPDYESLYDDRIEVAHEEGSCSPWLFSPRAFSALIRDIEGRTTWQYSGGVELLLLNATNEGERHSFVLDYSRVMSVDLVKAKKHGTIESVHHLFEDIFRIARKRKPGFHVDDISDELGAKTFWNEAKSWLIDIIPSSIGKKAKSISFFAIHDIKAKPNKSN